MAQAFSRTVVEKLLNFGEPMLRNVGQVRALLKKSRIRPLVFSFVAALPRRVRFWAK